FFDYLDLQRCGTEVRADNVAALRIAERLGYTEFARGHEVHYRDGAYADEVWLLMQRATWDERWAKSEREYVPFGAVG
ncbi:MAG TPA: GNAT family protein, partial [Candidatus Limnocylindria bacterium]|nr:GNAT family protein [Candidatus Limnocylindria bacterium]